MTKAFINADLLSKTRPIPRFYPNSFFHKNGGFTDGFAKLSVAHLFIKKNRHRMAITSYLVRHFLR